MKTVIHFLPKGAVPPSFDSVVADEKRAGRTVLISDPRPPLRAELSPARTSRPSRLGSAPRR